MTGQKPWETCISSTEHARRSSREAFSFDSHVPHRRFEHTIWKPAGHVTYTIIHISYCQQVSYINPNAIDPRSGLQKDHRRTAVRSPVPVRNMALVFSILIIIVAQTVTDSFGLG